MPANVAHRFLSLNCAVKLAKAANNNNESNSNNNNECNSSCNNNSSSSVKPQQQQQTSCKTNILEREGAKKRRKTAPKRLQHKMLFESVDVVAQPRDVRVKERGKKGGCKNPRTTILRLFALRLVAAFQTKNAEMLHPTPLPSSPPHPARQTAFVARSRVHGFIYLAHKFSQRTSGIFLQLCSSSFFSAPFCRRKGRRGQMTTTFVCIYFGFQRTCSLDRELPPSPSPP